jgi:Protein of unknown function (DUF1036)
MSMYKRLFGIVLMLAMGLVSSGAQAWVKFQNNWTGTVWVTHYYSIMSPPTNCLLDDIGCWINSNGTWIDGGPKTEGWWQIAPGGSKKPYGGDWHQLTVYRYYAEDDDGGFWGPPGPRRCGTNAEFHRCDATPCDTNANCGSGNRCITYSADKQTGGGCCGFWCSPDDYTFNLNP